MESAGSRWQVGYNMRGRHRNYSHWRGYLCADVSVRIGLEQIGHMTTGRGKDVSLFTVVSRSVS